MVCRVGMPTSPNARIQYWKNREDHSYSKILARGLTYKQAQDYEKRVAKAKGCKQSSGGSRVAGKVWSVYYVSGGVRLCLMGLQLIWMLEEGSIFRERERRRRPLNNEEIQYLTDTAQWIGASATVTTDCSLRWCQR